MRAPAPLLLRIDRDVVHVEDPPPAQLPLRQPEPADRLAVGLDHEDEVARRLQPNRPHGGEVGLGLLLRRLVRLAAWTSIPSAYPALGTATKAGNSSAVIGRRRTVGSVGVMFRGDYRGWYPSQP
jgi:hypothetical protein